MARRTSVRSADAVDQAADELYGLPLERFTAARNERARQVRDEGDVQAAAAIAKLAKPNTVGWLANQLVRAHPEQVGPLLELGAAMRAATAALDAEQLRTLSAQQRRLVHAIVQHARRLAGDRRLGDEVVRGLEDTLHAALADAQAAEELASGRLTGGLSRSGFPSVDAAAAAAAPKARPKAAPAGTDAGVRPDAAAARLRQAQQDEAEAHRAAERAAAEQGHALRRLDEAQRAVDDAQRALEQARATARDARGAVKQADRVARAAQQRLDEATQRRRRLSG